jgi:hypothetical protein
MKFKFAAIAAATVMASALAAHAVLYNVGASVPTSYPGPVTPPAGAPHSVDGWGYPGDTVTLGSANGSGSFALVNGATYYNMPIGTLLWGGDYTYNGTATQWDYPAHWTPLTFTINATRSITIGTGTGNISQVGTLNVTWADDYLSLSAGPMASVLVLDGVQWYQVDITPNSLPSVGTDYWPNGDPPAGGWAQAPRAMTATFQVTAVPEPTTMIAGALLLLPFGASTLRMLRKSRKA